MESVKITTSYDNLMVRRAAVSSALLIVCVRPGSNPASGVSMRSRTEAQVQCRHLGYEEKNALLSVAYVPKVPCCGSSSTSLVGGTLSSDRMKVRTCSGSLRSPNFLVTAVSEGTTEDTSGQFFLKVVHLEQSQYWCSSVSGGDEEAFCPPQWVPQCRRGSDPLLHAGVGSCDLSVW